MENSCQIASKYIEESTNEESFQFFKFLLVLESFLENMFISVKLAWQT